MTPLEIADELYGLPLADFTAARDARARELKGTPEGALVKALRKPTTAAWVVNLLVRFETEQVDQLLSLGAALRAAQEGLDAAQLRALTAQRRQLTAAMTVRARALARERGLRVTEAVAEQVESTLTAAMLDEGAARAVRSGLLIGPLVATGFTPVDAAAAVALPDALGYAVAPAARELHAVPAEKADKAEQRRAAAEKALAEAQAEAEAAAAAEREAAQRLADAQAGALQAQAELDDLRRRVVEAEQRAEDADDALVEAEDDHQQAAEAATAAQERLAQAQADL